jgi:dTDP-4-amino-4,6-dideoxygalactose transaminase
LQPCFGYLGYRNGDFPCTEQLAAEALALPIHESLTKADLEYVSERIRRFYQ